MQKPTFPRCSHLGKTCSGICTGYSTTGSCPPLIVLAVLSAMSPPFAFLRPDQARPAGAAQ